MNTFLAVLAVILKAFTGGFTDAINAARRDKALEELGYTKAQRDTANALVEKVKDAAAARAALQRDLASDPGSLRKSDGYRRD